MLYHNYFMNKETGELATYSQACKDFYGTPRGGARGWRVKPWIKSTL